MLDLFVGTVAGSSMGFRVSTGGGGSWGWASAKAPKTLNPIRVVL